MALMAHTIQNKKRLLTRIRRIQGQAQALERALEAEHDCAAILQQLAAVRGAVNGMIFEVLEGHVRTHLGEGEAGDQTRDTRDADVDLVLSVMRSYMK
jgi:DNA-binding FrmR family transcriptional regulator